MLEKVQRRFTKMIVNMDGLSYEDRLQSLNLWSLEERLNRQDLIEVFKMAKGMTRIRLQELFTLEENMKGTRGHSLKLTKMRCKESHRRETDTRRRERRGESTRHRTPPPRGRRTSTIHTSASIGRSRSRVVDPAVVIVMIQVARAVNRALADSPAFLKD